MAGSAESPLRWTGPALRAAAVASACVAVAVGMRLSGAPAAMADSMALVVMAIGFWALGVLAEPLTGLLFLLGCVTIAGLDPEVVFSGFTSSAFWLIFAGVILSAAATRTGLSGWLAGRVLARRFGEMTYGARVALVVAFSAGLALILPSTLARVAILMPIVLALCDRAGYGLGGRGRTGLVLGAAIGTYILPVSFLPANLPNVVLAGSLESLYRVTPTFGEYLLLHFPVVGAVKGAALVAILTLMFREAPTAAVSGSAAEPGLTGPGQRLTLVMATTLALWSTDFLHHVSPAWVGLGAALLILLPATRILDLKEVPFNTATPMLIYIGAVLGIGGVMAGSGAGAALSRQIVEALPLAEAGDALRLGLLAMAATVTALVTTTPAAPAISAPFFADIAAQTGWTIEAVGMAQVLGYATPLMPYQLPPLMMALAMTGVTMREATQTLLVLAVVTTPVTLTLAHFWWWALGWY